MPIPLRSSCVFQIIAFQAFLVVAEAFIKNPRPASTSRTRLGIPAGGFNFIQQFLKFHSYPGTFFRSVVLVMNLILESKIQSLITLRLPRNLIRLVGDFIHG